MKRIVVKHNKGKVLLPFPVTRGAAGAAALVVLAPWLAALGVTAGIMSRCTVEVERSSNFTSGQLFCDLYRIPTQLVF